MNTLDKLIKAKNDYLKKNPHLQELQDQIDITMANLEPEDRLIYLSSMIKYRLQIIKSESEKLKGLFGKKEVAARKFTSFDNIKLEG